MVTLSYGYMVTRQYASVIWSPYHLGEIAKLESVQRRFTKRLVGLRNMTYVDRINFLKLNSLEERRLRFDIIFTYKILFGLVNIKCSDIFAFKDATATRGHSYKLYAKTSRINVRHNFYCNRVVNIWNRLPASDCHFETFNSFKSFLAAQNLTALLLLTRNSKFVLCAYFCISSTYECFIF